MRFKKAKTLIVAGVLALMAVVTVPVTAKAAHVIEGSDGELCDNTYYYREEIGMRHIYYTNHQLTDGRRCTMSRMRYAHNRRCTSCHTVTMRDEVLDCTEKHTQCSIYIRSCNSK